MEFEYWQHEFIEIKYRGLHLLQKQIWSDCSFLVGTAPNQKVIAGHKLILAMASPVFERMFFGQLAEKDDPIPIPDVHPEAFQAMLEYIYSDSINISSFDIACQLFYVAKKYMLTHVVEKCSQYVREGLSAANACRTYEFAKLFDEPRLMEKSMEVITRNIHDVLDNPNFTDIEDSTLLAILDQDALNIVSELDLFNAVVRFANARGIIADDTLQKVEDIKEEELNMAQAMAILHDLKDRDKDDTPGVCSICSDSYPSPAAAAATEQSSTSNAAATYPVDDVKLIYSMDAQQLNNNKATIRQAIKKIRFLTMTTEEIAMGPARSKLLEQHEALAIFIKISSPTSDDYPMPDGFCNTRERRELVFQKRANAAFYHSRAAKIAASRARRQL